MVNVNEEEGGGQEATLHSAGFSHCQAGVRSLRGVTSRKGSPVTLIWGHLPLCCLGRLSAYQMLRNWHITPIFLFFPAFPAHFT